MSASQKEVELKLELPPASLPSINQVPLLKALKPSSSRAVEISVYFDTDKCKLRKNGVMLRVRRIGLAHVQKTGSLEQARYHIADGLALYRREAHATQAFQYGSHDAGVSARTAGSGVRVVH
jgi:hypothetical protein